MSTYLLLSAYRKTKNELFRIFKKYMNGHKLVRLLNEYFASTTNIKSDEIVWAYLKKNLNITVKDEKSRKKYEPIRGGRRAGDVMYMLKGGTGAGMKISTYLDVGTGRGWLPYKLSQRLRLGDNVYAVDIHSEIDPSLKNKINFTTYNGYKLPYPSNSFNLITSFMVLHHVKKLSTLLRSVYDVLKPNGLFIIREHDIYNNNLKRLVVIQHLIQSKIYDLEERVDNPDNPDYYAKYRSKPDLLKLIKKVGFKVRQIKYYPRISNNPTKYYYMILRK